MFDLKSLNINALTEIVLAHKEKSFLAKDIFKFIQAKGISSIDELTTLSKSFREKLIQEKYFISNLIIDKVLISHDQTKKFRFKTADNYFIETVLLSNQFNDKSQTICLSTQVGCKFACTFCATGQMGFERNLSIAEITDQVLKIKTSESVSNITNLVFMGMGEPFDNYENVMEAIRIFNSPNGLNIGARHITVSTVGIPNGIEKFSKENLQIRLAISLHSANQLKREKLMPIAKKYPLSELKNALLNYQQTTSRRITLEYILLKNINDTHNDFSDLLDFIKNLDVHINLIEFNEHSTVNLVTDKSTITQFKKWLTDSGIEATIRFKQGQDIMAACGQLSNAM